MRIVTRAFGAMLLSVVAFWPLQGAAQGRIPVPPAPDFNRFDLATYSFAGTARGDVPAVVRVRLDARELLHVALELWPTNRGGAPDRTIRRALRLSPAAFENLLADVRILSVAEIRGERGGPICRVVPSPQMQAGTLSVLRDYDPLTDTFGLPAVIQSATGCWNPIRINLAQPQDRELAGQFRAKLEILAAQVLRHSLVLWQR